MKILVVAATKNEIAEVLKSTPRGSVDFLVTGVGMVATAFHLGRRLSEVSHYDLIVNVGIAGAIDKSFNMGEVVNVSADCLVELGAEDHEKWLSIEQLGFGEGKYESYYPNRDALVDELRTAIGITVNKVHGNEKSIAELIMRHPTAQIESMEGAAVFYAAQQSQIPVLQIRSISNYVEARNRENWDIARAIDRLNEWLSRFIASKIHE
jgi:futalosine hydrolase